MNYKNSVKFYFYLWERRIFLLFNEKWWKYFWNGKKKLKINYNYVFVLFHLFSHSLTIITLDPRGGGII